MRPDLFIKMLTPLELVCYGILIADRIEAITAIYEVKYFGIVDPRRKHHLTVACSVLVLMILSQSMDIISY